MRFHPTLVHLAHTLANAADLPGTPPPTETARRPVDWDVWVALAVRHRVASFLGARCDRLRAVPADVRGELRSEALRETRNAILRLDACRRITALLAGRVDFVVLKGPALVGTLYETWADRAMDDVDLLVRDTKAQGEATAILRAAGFAARGNADVAHHTPLLRHPGLALGVELHTNFRSPPLPQPLLDALWDRRTGGALDPVGQLVHHAVHLFNDPVDAPVLRGLFEIAAMAVRLPSAAWAELRSLPCALEVESCLARSLGMAHDLFCSPMPGPRVPPSYAERWLSFLMARADDSPVTRVLRHVARRQFDEVRLTGRRPAAVLCSVAVESLCKAGLGRIERIARRRRGPTRADWPYLRIDGAALVFNPSTEEVHLLNTEATEVWLACGDGLAQPGGRGTARQALRALEGCGLVARAAGPAPHRD